MSVRGLTPLFKWGFGLRRSKFLVPLISNNMLVSGEEAVSASAIHPLSRDIVLEKENAYLEELKKNKEQSEKNANDPILVESKGTKANTPETSAQRLINELKQEVKQAEKITQNPYSEMEDDKLIELIDSGKLVPYKLESDLGDCTRAVEIRRKLLERSLKRIDNESPVKNLPYDSFDYSQILGACCENVIGYVPVPIGIAGPLLLDGEEIHVPMATTEGALVASTHRGCKAISSSGGARSHVLGTGMTRAPVVVLPNIEKAVALKNWIEDEKHFEKISQIFDSTSQFAKLKSIKTTLAGKYVYIRFKSLTGDAMGMNIVSKGVEKVMEFLSEQHPEMRVISVSGNYCTDKKPSSINWTEGRGRSVVCEAEIKKNIVTGILKTSVEALVELNLSKNLIGSAMAGSVGGFNAHAANLVTAIFLATGQDVAQNVESSNCITLMEKTEQGDLYISVTMPSIEVGTVGGGTFLPAQSSCLDILKAKGPSPGNPGDNADRLARIICGTVLAGELSLMAALSAGHLMKSHLKLNRKPKAEGTQ